MNPPFNLTSRILTLVSEISILLGRYEGLHAPIPQPELRRQNRIRNIQSSLSIEGNTLNVDQVSALFDKKRVIGPKKDILEVQNAIELYKKLHEFNSNSEKDLLKAHLILMKGLTLDPGKFRSSGVGILKGSRVSHIAPPAKQVPKLMADLFEFLKKNDEVTPLIKACVFHYELEFIHPFSDGNGRIGRFWQSLILTKFNPAFEYIPIESLIKKRQSEYYKTLEKSDKAGDSTVFLEFVLDTIKESLRDFINNLKPEPETAESRLELASKEFHKRKFTRKEYILFFKTISTATASRDLSLGVKSNRLKKFGTKAVTKYQFQ